MGGFSSLNGRDKFYFLYFLIHIPITVLIDSNIVVPREYQWEISTQILDFHVETNKDVLFMGPRPIWFQVFGAVELLFQLPLFVYCIIHMYAGTKRHYAWMSLYGFNASFTTLVCLFHVYFASDEYGLTLGEKGKLVGIYVPYLLIPLGIMVDYVGRIGQELTKHKRE
ncbi:uncharacterized protein CANTADRAFT_6254 [Suhomyces tanzawaensis NRRL Y-17324]|uniref:Efficient mitochondria targeting-associated protein 19 n=1 Tax=Suhomyces tanzawaensis NRRL Y-17324 TaxID=984487 RepID=A0A1E4SHV2_9ASCO|nr:uncharacterized protein CANTADRAFT_6254 [Suhomyces tanzawaensis NRRL Y-17324]ODV79075.1 hypothetical protein CANTADRAFT_6254 [Suhomyces tanzawaensis NRRL Y-17324]